jgi:hypothetical protein
MRASKSIVDDKPYLHSSDRPASYEYYTASDNRQTIFAQQFPRQLSTFLTQALHYPSMTPAMPIGNQATIIFRSSMLYQIMTTWFPPTRRDTAI